MIQAPNTKVTASAMGGACAVLTVWLIRLLLQVEVEGEVAAAMATVYAFVFGYVTTETSK